jgi:ABC-type glycerol-3-phosphate transport system permease component
MMRRSFSTAALVHAALIAVALVSIFPVFIMVSGSLKSSAELARNSWGLPHLPTLDNYMRLVNYNAGIIVRTYVNSLFIATSYTLLTLLVSSLAAYAFAKYRFPGKEVLFFLLLATMMVPAELNVTPLYLMFSKMKWLNTYQVQIIPGIANVFALFLLRQYMETIPDSLIDAAHIDGAGHLRTYYDVVVPTSMPALSALGILVFLAKWNDYLFPRIMLDKMSVMPIMVILPTLNAEESARAVPWELVLTGCVLVTIPLLLVFFLLQDKFMSSVTIGAVKE